MVSFDLLSHSVVRMDLASGKAASREFVFVICIILLSLRVRD